MYRAASTLPYAVRQFNSVSSVGVAEVCIKFPSPKPDLSLCKAIEEVLCSDKFPSLKKVEVLNLDPFPLLEASGLLVKYNKGPRIG